jgi:hypothetical protein
MFMTGGSCISALDFRGMISLCDGPYICVADFPLTAGMIAIANNPLYPWSAPCVPGNTRQYNVLLKAPLGHCWTSK